MHPGIEWLMTEVISSLPPTWETWTEFPATETGFVNETYLSPSLSLLASSSFLSASFNNYIFKNGDWKKISQKKTYGCPTSKSKLINITNK